MICRHCGAEWPSRGDLSLRKLCPNCGEKILAEALSEEATPGSELWHTAHDRLLWAMKNGIGKYKVVDFDT